MFRLLLLLRPVVLMLPSAFDTCAKHRAFASTARKSFRGLLGEVRLETWRGRLLGPPVRLRAHSSSMLPAFSETGKRGCDLEGFLFSS